MGNRNNNRISTEESSSIFISCCDKVYNNTYIIEYKKRKRKNISNYKRTKIF